MFAEGVQIPTVTSTYINNIGGLALPGALPLGRGLVLRNELFAVATQVGGKLKEPHSDDYEVSMWI